jgi:hypothetical protein
MALQAVNTQEANKAASNRLPPLWAMVAMVLLGWNEAMSILTSPLKLVRPPVSIFGLWPMVIALGCRLRRLPL